MVRGGVPEALAVARVGLRSARPRCSWPAAERPCRPAPVRLARDDRSSASPIGGAVGAAGHRAALRRPRRLVHDRDVRERAGTLAEPAGRRARRPPGSDSSSSRTSAVNGFTSADVIAVELPRLDGAGAGLRHPPDRRQRRRAGRPGGDLSRPARRRSSAALRARLPAERILLVTTPDYTVTPAGADYGDPATKRAAIRRVNAIAHARRRGRLGIAVVDIFDISETGAATDRGHSWRATVSIRPVASTPSGWSGSRRWSGRSSAQPAAVAPGALGRQRWRWSSSSRASSIPK